MGVATTNKCVIQPQGTHQHAPLLDSPLLPVQPIILDAPKPASLLPPSLKEGQVHLKLGQYSRFRVGQSLCLHQSLHHVHDLMSVCCPTKGPTLLVWMLNMCVEMHLKSFLLMIVRVTLKVLAEAGLTSSLDERYKMREIH